MALPTTGRADTVDARTGARIRAPTARIRTASPVVTCGGATETIAAVAFSEMLPNFYTYAKPKSPTDSRLHLGRKSHQPTSHD